MIIFTDIDDTLMKTHRKISDFSHVVPGALGHDGQHLSFIDKARKKLIDTLLSENTCIPVTARSRKSFNNLLIKFNHHAVLNFGATILNSDGSIEHNWHQHILAKHNALETERFFNFLQLVLKDILIDFEIKSSFEDGIYNYLNLRNNERNQNKIQTLKNAIEVILHQEQKSDDFYFYITDRDVTIIPSFIKKELAVQYLLKHHYSDKILSIGIGDHHNDLSFMSHCDFAMLPTDSSLMKFIKNKE